MLYSKHNTTALGLFLILLIVVVSCIEKDAEIEDKAYERYRHRMDSLDKAKQEYRIQDSLRKKKRLADLHINWRKT